MPFNKKKNTGTPKRDYTKMKTPHTYAIIFAAIFLCWLLTFLVPAGKFSTHKVEYTDSNGAVKTKTVLMADTFRYSYRLDREAVKDNLTAMSGDEALMESLGVDPAELDAFLETDSSEWTQEDLDELGLTDDVLYGQYGESIKPGHDSRTEQLRLSHQRYQYIRVPESERPVRHYPTPRGCEYRIQ